MTFTTIGFVVEKRWYDHEKKKNMTKKVSRRYTSRSAAELFAKMAKDNEPEFEFYVTDDMAEDGIS